MNCIVFLGALWILLAKQRKSQMLAVTSTVLFLIATVHVSASLRGLLEAFIDIPTPAPPLYSIVYWSNFTSKVAITRSLTYEAAVFLQDFILIWRLWVVFGRDWKVIVLPIVAELAHLGIALAGVIMISTGTPLTTPVLKPLGEAGWALDLSVNVCVTVAIAARLWVMGRKIRSQRRNRYFAPIFTIVESGAIFATVTFVMLILYVRGSPLAFNGEDISTQLAVLTPLLIITRVGFGMTHGLPGHTSSTMTSSTSGGPVRSHTQPYELNRIRFMTPSTTNGAITVTTESNTVIDDETSPKYKDSYQESKPASSIVDIA